MLGDAGRGTSGASAEVDADGRSECFGAEFLEETLGADFGGGARDQDGQTSVPDESEGVLDTSAKEWMEPREKGEEVRVSQLRWRIDWLGVANVWGWGMIAYQGWSSISKRCMRGRKGAMARRIGGGEIGVEMGEQSRSVHKWELLRLKLEHRVS